MYMEEASSTGVAFKVEQGLDFHLGEGAGAL